MKRKCRKYNLRQDINNGGEFIALFLFCNSTVNFDVGVEG